MRNCKLWSVFSKGVFLPTGLLAASLLSVPAAAVVNVEGTRVIFNAEETTASLNLANTEKQPTLVQLWSDNGDLRVSPDKVSTPVIAVPPVFRMAPGEIRTVRLLLSSRTGLPGDRETLYWLNVFQVPPNTAEAVANKERKVILPLRLRMKVFVRPVGVDKPVEQDGNRLQFAVKKSGESSAFSITNPTPWYMTLLGITLDDIALENVMVPPRSGIDIPLKGAVKEGQIQYQIINDMGDRWSYTANVSGSSHVALPKSL